MRSCYVIPVICGCLVVATSGVVASVRFGARTMWLLLVCVAATSCGWGFWAWSRQHPIESPLYGYLLLASAPPVVIGATVRVLDRRKQAAVVQVTVSAIAAALTALVIPWIMYAFP